MSDPRLHLSDPQSAGLVGPPRPLGRTLVDAGVIAPADLYHALNMQQHVDARLGEVLIAEGLAQQDDVMIALSEQYGAQLADLQRDPPELALADHLPAALALAYDAVPWMQLGDVLLVATSRPDRFEDLRLALGTRGRMIMPAIAEDRAVQTQISRLYGFELAYRAATRVPAVLSCRTWDISHWRRSLWAFAVLLPLIVVAVAAPMWTFTIGVLWAFLTLLMTTVLKAAALYVEVREGLKPEPPPPAEDSLRAYPLPRVSVMVALLHEKEIAGALIERLSRLTYPKSMLDVILVLEEGDDITRATLAETDLPPWISVIEVPEANRLKTKPRALNYALDFCKGSIIGVWDAEDAPEPDQIEQVVRRFHTAPGKVACLQGMLDYYNSRANWFSRCFTIEYAAWWRVLLPGVARLGLVIPLGGTTLFFRRSALERLGGWDAHNVTEDADLGVRLARAGYVTELIQTVTYEEANCRPWPWIKQRSRWLKGFLITWCVHMRTPGALRRDIGWVRFFGLQTMLLATVCQFACAPLLWSFWLSMAGMTHPVEVTLGTPVLWSMVVVFILAETLNLGLSLFAVRGEGHRHLMWWVFTLPFYFTFGAAAAYKALWEFVISPFYWDKTQHGVTPQPDAAKV